MLLLSPGLRRWFLPSVALLATLVVWGAIRYPRLPDLIPGHIGIDGVDAWAERSFGSAFTPVLIYAGVTVVMAACAEMTLRITPRDELPVGAGPFAGGLPPSPPHRPGSRASARRMARALLVLNACIGLSFLAGCAALWHTAPGQEPPVWLPPAALGPLLVGTVLTVAAALTGRKR
ncbi:DUF1648 domain-containing protein [Streptomyces sp. NPDC016309]|uniref:DUF1648 domain-containing protein n=1 Tax=Streptomyces sp. NPDC016309 TaxID=3364965 RepID=UPI0036F75E43